MTSTEQLVEAVMYADENDIEWYNVFDSTTEAIRILKKALKESPDEGQMVCLLSVQSADEDMFESCTPEHAYRQALREMHSKLIEAT